MLDDQQVTDTNRTHLTYDVETAVLDRYKQGAKQVEAALCCPTDYQGEYLKIIPSEILEKDYGCGDPSRYVKPGETVLDLGSGSGKICYIIAQKVGATGRVIGVDFNDEMLSLSRKYQAEIAQKLGYDNVEFVKGKIQDLSLNLDLIEPWLKANSITDLEGINAFESQCEHFRQTAPLIPDSSVDVVVSNCVLNLVKPQNKQQLFQELYRVLKRGGRAVISDIVADEDPTPEMINNPELWSGCVSGAFREDEFLAMFEKAGFYGIEILSYQAQPWQVVNGIEFRSITIQAFKGKDGICLDRNQAVIYQGPWKKVLDDDNHSYERGKRTAVCEKTFQILTHPQGPYQNSFIPVEPYTEVPVESAPIFDGKRATIRHPQETKGTDYQLTTEADNCCDPGNNCC